ncbi:TPA: type 1 fimbrial protein [Escherichia coli]|nr:type 1 fimbrial protein [Escherichia coli]
MKKSLVTQMVAGVLLLCGSTAAMAAANQVGNHQQNLGANVTAGTCSVTWPSDVSFSVSSADVDSAGHLAVIGEVQQAGNIELAGCPASTPIKYTVQASTPKTADPYKAYFNGGMRTIAYVLSSTPTTSWALDGREANLGTTDASGNLSVPVYARLLKTGTTGSVTPGSYQAQVSYTISYD